MRVLSALIVIQILVWCVYADYLTRFKSTSASVKSILEDEYAPANFVYIDGHSIRIFPKTSSRSDLLSGDYSSSGYRSSRSKTSARWSDPSDMVFLDKQTLLITDRRNHCLRKLSRTTNGTSDYVGTCQKSGYLDGSISAATFNLPTGLVKHGKSIFVADSGNNAVREINGNIVLTHIQTTNNNPLYLDIDPSEEFIYFTTVRGVYRTELYGHQTKEITGLNFTSSSVSSQKGFSTLRGIKVLNDGVLLVADIGSDRVLIVDTYFGKVEYICSGSGRLTGSYRSCKLTDPQSILLTQDELYIGSAAYISKSPKQDVIDKVFPHIERCPQQADIIMRLPRGQTAENYTWTHPQASATQPRKPVTCTVCPPNTQSLSEGVHHIRYVFSNQYYNTTCQFTIRVLKHAERDSTGAHTGALLSEDMVCPKDYKVYLAPGMQTATTEWQKPSYPRVIKCIDCPPTKAKLTVGRHKFTYKYLDIQSSTKYYCSFHVDVLREAASGSKVDGSTCTTKSIIVPIKTGSTKATVKLPADISGVRRSIKLPAGNYNFTVTLSNNKTCIETYKVMVAVEKPKIFVDYKVVYKVGCTKLSDIAQTVIDSFLQQHTPHIDNLCGCKSTNRTRSCYVNDDLVVRWRTKQPYPSSSELPGTLAAIRRYQDNVIRASGTFMQITVINRNPPIVAAEADSNGLVVRLSKRYECKPGKTYQASSKLCV